MGLNPHHVVPVDLDGDGRLDLVVSSNDATFGSVRYHASFGGAYVAVADLDGDMAPDLLGSGEANLTVGRSTCQ